MNVIVIIPARYQSSRYPGKPLVELALPDGRRKSLIRLTWEAAHQVSGVSGVFVATDDHRIAEAASGFGAEVIMTSSDCENGTARCAQAVERARLDADLVVNLQGDAPLTPGWFVEALISTMRADPSADVATPVLRCDARTYGRLLADRKAGRVGGTTVVLDRAGRALYFSKEVIPFAPPTKNDRDLPPVFHHVGVYAYRPDALQTYRRWPMGHLERQEGLEQLRFLENGRPITCVEVDARGRTFWELNNPEDRAKIETALGELA